MAHYAFLDADNIVTEVIVGKDEGEDGIDWELRYSEIRGVPCKRTSYNTFGGVHKMGGVPFRKNYAGIGYTYNAEIDGFVPPKPYESWVLNSGTGLWESPVPKPTEDVYSWDESTISWVLN